MVSEFNDKLAILYKIDPALTGPIPSPAYSSEHIGHSTASTICQPPGSFIHSFLMTSAGPFYFVDPISHFPSKTYAIFNNHYSKNKPFRKSKNKDVCFYMISSVALKKLIQITQAKCSLIIPFLLHPTIVYILSNGFIHSFIGKLHLLSKH